MHNYDDVQAHPAKIDDDQRLKLNGYVWRKPMRDPDLDYGLDYMTDRPVRRNSYAEQYLGMDWED